MSQEFESDFEITQEATGEDSLQASEEAGAIEAETEATPAAIPTSFGTVTDRLSEIAEIMEDETMPLDDALDLLEEAVALGMQASSLLESDMNERDAEEISEEGGDEIAEEAELDAEDAAVEAAIDAEGARIPAEDSQVGEAGVH